MYQLTIEPDENDVLKAQFYLAHVKNGWRKAVCRGVNKAAVTGRKFIANEIRATYTVKYGGLLKAMPIKKANWGNLTAIIKSSGPPLEIKKYKTRKNTKRKASQVQILKAGALKPIEAGGIKAFDYNGTILQRRGPERGPLDAKYGNSIPVMIVGDRVFPKAQVTIDVALHKYINAQIYRSLA